MQLKCVYYSYCFKVNEKHKMVTIASCLKIDRYPLSGNFDVKGFNKIPLSLAYNNKKKKTNRQKGRVSKRIVQF